MQLLRRCALKPYALSRHRANSVLQSLTSDFSRIMPRRFFRGLSSTLNHDFCPWANDYVYWLKRPIGWVVLAFATSLLLGLYVSKQAFLASGAIAAVGIIGSLWPWISTLGIRGELSWDPSRCEEDETIQTKLTISNHWPWPVWGLTVEADEDIAGNADSTSRSISLSKIPALTKTSFHWNSRPSARGIYPKTTPRLSTAFPFGIWSCFQSLAVTEPLIVWPRMTKLMDVPPNSGNQQSGVGGTTERAGNDGDWTGVRPFRPGDSLRHVHWAQTARRDQLIVFEHQSLSKQTVVIALDTHAAALLPKRDVDCMVRILASVAAQFLSHSWDVRVAMDGPWHSLSPSKRHAWLDDLAAWEPTQAPRELSSMPSSMRSLSQTATTFGIPLAVSKTPGLAIVITGNTPQSIASASAMPLEADRNRWVFRVDGRPFAIPSADADSLQTDSLQPDSLEWESPTTAEVIEQHRDPRAREWTLSSMEDLDPALQSVWRHVCQSNVVDTLRCAS